MSSPYHEGSRSLQDRFDTRRLADRIEEKFLARPTIDVDDRAFIERMDMFFLATADADGRPQCSYKGGASGFVRVLDERTVAFPSYDGNGMYLSTGNVLRNPHVGMLFVDFTSARPLRLRLNGTASIDAEAASPSRSSSAETAGAIQQAQGVEHLPPASECGPAPVASVTHAGHARISQSIARSAVRVDDPDVALRRAVRGLCPEMCPQLGKYDAAEDRPTPPNSALASQKVPQ